MMVMPSPGIFQKEDLYCRKQWRCVQHMCDEFWSRWRKEFYATLQARQKVRRNFPVRDIGLVCDDTFRNICDKEGLVHSLQLVIGKNSSNDKEISLFEQPVNKLVFLVKNKH